MAMHDEAVRFARSEGFDLYVISWPRMANRTVAQDLAKGGFEPRVTLKASRASACPGWAMLTLVHATLFLSFDESHRGHRQPHQIAYPTGGQALARRLRLVPGLGAHV
jgi:hypothetical protein